MPLIWGLRKTTLRSWARIRVLHCFLLKGKNIYRQFMSNQAATVKKYQYLGKVEVNLFHGESQRRLSEKLLPPIVLAFFSYYWWKHSLFSPSKSLCNCFSPSFVLWPWLWEICNFMLVSLSLIFADSYVYPNVIVCDYKQDNIFAIPVLYPTESGGLRSGVFFLVLWGQGPDPVALTAVLCDYTTCSLRITCRLCWILSVGKIEQFFAISFTPLKYWCFCLCLHLFVSFLLLVNFGPIVPLFRLGYCPSL